MNELQYSLKEISGGRVLDVATGGGSFIQELVEGLKNYDTITGIDNSTSAQAVFERTIADQPRINYRQMDAMHLEFEDAYFDTVCVANSLHHFKRPDHLLNEMLRVLKPGGTFIILEMYRDHQPETRKTHVLLHHWWAAVDRLNHTFLSETYTREQIIAMVYWLGLVNTREVDLIFDEDSPNDPEVLKELEEVIDRYIIKADGNMDLQREGEELRERVHTVGFQSASSLLIVGNKPPER